MKTLPVIASTLLALSTTSFAETKQPAPCDANQNVNAITNSSGGTGFGVFGELLFLRPHIDNLHYAIDDRNPIPTGSFTLTRGFIDAKYKRVAGSYDPGFRIGLTKHCDRDGWDAKLVWTYHNSNKKDPGIAQSLSGIDDSRIVPVFRLNGAPSAISNMNANAFLFAFSAESTLKNRLHLVDFNLGKEFRPEMSHWFTYRPYAGFRYINLDSKTTATYLQELAGSTDRRDPDDIFTNYVEMNLSICGIGPIVGVDTEFGLGKGFSIFASGSASLPLINFDSDITEILTYTATNVANITGSPFTMKARDKQFAIKNMIDIDTGLMWEKLFKDDTIGLTLALGWEAHVLINGNVYYSGIDVTNLGKTAGSLGDISYRGLKLSAKVDF